MTKKQNKEKFSSIIKKYQAGEQLIYADREWILGLLRAHTYYQRKASNPEVRISVEYGEVGRRRGKYLYLENKVPVTVSKLFAPVKRNPSKFDPKWHHKALRDEVAYQLTDFKNTEISKGVDSCAECGCKLTRRQMTVDHIYPFSSILKDWLGLKELQIEEIKLKGRGNNKRLKNSDLCSQWAEYHQDKSEFQILCRSCNSKLGNKPRSSKE